MKIIITQNCYYICKVAQVEEQLPEYQRVCIFFCFCFQTQL